MKLRIHGQSVRLRLNREDVDTLRAHHAVLASLDLGTQRFTYGLEARDDIRAVEAMPTAGGLLVVIPLPLAARFLEDGQTGIYAPDAAPAVVVEKDFRCLGRDDPQEDASAFPHP